MLPRTVCAVLTLGLLLSSSQLVGAEEHALERDILGYFRPLRRPPAAFTDIAELHLAGRGEYGWKATPPFYGMIKTAGGRTFALRKPTIDGLDIRFTSEAVRDVGYEFSGKLTRPDFSGGGIPIDEVMLRGTMRKMKNGRPIASDLLQFCFETGG